LLLQSEYLPTSHLDDNRVSGWACLCEGGRQTAEFNLYAIDKRRPSAAGTYLASCVVFAALTGRSPVGNSYLAKVDAQTAAFLQNVAWETVQEYYGK
jgi:hypothetical protein